jgi:hypothetical protein
MAAVPGDLQQAPPEGVQRASRSLSANSDAAVAPVNGAAAAIGNPRAAGPASAPISFAALVSALGIYWQALITLIGIVFATIGALAYFATNAQLEKLECMMAQNLLRQTLPARILQLETSIRLAQAEQKDIPSASSAFYAKGQEIEAFRDELKTARTQFQSLPPYSMKHCEGQGAKK